MTRPAILLLLSCAVAASAPTRAAADAATEARLRDALRAATTQVRALEDERAARDAESAPLRKEVETLRAELAAAKRAPRPAAGDGGAELRQRLAERTAAATQASEALAQCQAEARRRDDAARGAEGARAGLQTQMATLTERLARVEARNARMYQVGKDVIDWLSRIGVGGALAAREPFLGLKRVELENTAQDFEDKLLEQKVTP